jgi:hypothetical protein
VSLKVRSVFGAAFVIAALVPWVLPMASLLRVLVFDARIEPPAGTQEKELVAQWFVWWHVTMLAIFCVLLIRSNKIDRARKYAWIIGMSLFWPIVAVCFVWKEYFSTRPSR